LRVIIDTCIWSLVLRRRRGALSSDERILLHDWTEIVKRGDACLLGPVTQEVLSGIKHAAEFEKISDYLDNFEELPIEPVDFRQAATFFNKLRVAGIVATPIDLMIAAVSFRLNIEVFTTDPDFKHYSRHIPVRLF
jgi:predicted nucleic acid-binding protein